MVEDFRGAKGESETIGRLAPSPTGAQHVGNARTYLFAWLLARQAEKNRLVLRIEDLETPRVKAWAIEQIYEDLTWLGLDWDASPKSSAAAASLLQQSNREQRYREIIAILIANELVYPCTCTRSEMADAAAPHESSLDGVVYPGNCRRYRSADIERLKQQQQTFALRFRWDATRAVFNDRFYGEQSINPLEQLGDFVVWRGNHQAAYHLAVVVDDRDAEVNQVVRGADLIYSTYRQNAIYAALGWQPPNYIHVPLVIGNDGRRLAKRHGDTRLSTLREAGMTAEQLIGQLAHMSGLVQDSKPIRAVALLELDLLQKLSKQPLVWSE